MGSRIGRVLAATLALPVLLAPAPAAAVTYEAEPAFCRGAVVRDFMAPFERMPKLRAPGQDGRIGFFPGRNVALTPSEPIPRIAGQGEVGYQLDLRRRKRTARPRWKVTTALARVNRRGRRVEQVGRSVRRVRSVTLYRSIALGLPVPDRPGFYRLTSTFRSLSGRKLGTYGFYIRVARPIKKARLVANSTAYRAGQTVFVRVENRGTVLTRYGVPFAIERREDSTWVTAPESPKGPWILPIYFSAPGRSGACHGFWVPPTMPPGRYRMTKDVEFSHQRSNTHRTLTAEFDVLP